MTHGTERDTPTEGAADRDATDAPGRADADRPREAVPQPHDAPEAVAQVDDAVEEPTRPDPSDEQDEPAAAEPAAAEPAAAQPGTDESAAAEPAAAEPAAAEPAAAEPGTDESAADEPAAAEPGTDESAVDEPPAVEPAAVDSAAAEPAAAGPDAAEPTAAEPPAAAPAAVDPGAEVSAPAGASDDEEAVDGGTDQNADALAPAAAPVPPGRAAAAGAARSRPLAPATSEPLAAWPSWDDVAVTAPAASAPTDGPGPESDAVDDGARATPDPADATGAQDAPSDATPPTTAADAGTVPAAGPSDDVAGPADDGAATAAPDHERTPGEAPATAEVPREDTTRPPLPPLDLGGLSALAFTALNAASVGVPAHALPKSPLATPPPADGDASGPGTGTGAVADGPDLAVAPDAAARTSGASGTDDATATEAASGPEASDAAQEPPVGASTAAGAGTAEPTTAEPTTAEPTTAEPTTADPAPAEPTADEPATDEPATDEPATDEPATDEPTATAAGPRADETAVVPVAGAVPATPEDLATRATPAVAAPSSWPATADGGATRSPVPGGPVEQAPGAEREDSPLDVFEPDERPSRWPRVLAITGGALVLVAGLYAGTSYALADRVPRGATVAGVEIGSMSSAEAERTLTDELAERTAAVVPVIAQEVQADLDPVAAGLTLDADATVARLTGVDLAQPVRLWRHLVGVGEQPPVTQVDADALDAALTQLSGSLTLAPVDGTVVFADGAAHATQAVDGWVLDAAEAAAVLERGWLTELRPVVLPTEVVPPAVPQEETDRALVELAEPLTAAPVTVRVADRQAVLDVATLTANAAVVPVDGALDLQLDGAALAEAVLTQLPDLLTTSSDARFEFQDGAPVIVPGTPGTTLDRAALATAVAQAATAGTDRVAPVELVQSDPAETTAALEALGVKEVVSEFSTPLTSEPRRTSNIANGLKNITGTLVRPGETFSLTEALGPVDAAHGFVEAGAIVNGEHRDAWGGGLSQVSTTTYNAAYFAGYEDVEHTPHSEWFQRYPEGREATIFTGVLDLKWKNNTPYGALVQGFVADGRAHVRIWSTKHFTVETEKSGRSGVVSPTTVYSQSATCEPQSAGNPGFTVTNTRRVLLNGEVVDTESQTWRYKPQNKVVCGAAPAPGAPTP